MYFSPVVFHGRIMSGYVGLDNVEDVEAAMCGEYNLHLHFTVLFTIFTAAIYSFASNGYCPLRSIA